jgi:hypothetical protein
MPDLKLITNPLWNIPKVKYYQGVWGIINIFEDALKVWHDIYGLLKIDNDVNPELLEYMGW